MGEFADLEIDRMLDEGYLVYLIPRRPPPRGVCPPKPASPAEIRDMFENVSEHEET